MKKYKTMIWEVVIILVIAIFLTILSETDNMRYLIKFSFLTIYIPYVIGRLVGEYRSKGKLK